MAIKAIGIKGRKEYSKVDPREIVIDERENYRSDYSHVSDLKKSILANGLLTPIELMKMSDKRLLLVSGFCRMKAVKSIIDDNPEAFPHIDAYVHTKPLSDSERLLRNLASNEGKKPTALEECEAYTRLIQWNFSQQEIAKRVGKSQAHISQILKLRNASQDLKQAIDKKEIGVTKAIKITEQSNGSIKAQSEAIKNHKTEKKKQKEEKQKQRTQEEYEKIAEQSPAGFTVPKIPGMSDKPVTNPTPKSNAKTSSYEGADFGEWIHESVKEEWKSYDPNQDKIKLKAQIDDLIDLLHDLRDEIGGEVE
jgi:ParB/RepB/Spo0J family partition protein